MGWERLRAKKHTKNVYHLICSSVILFLHVSNFLNFLIRIFVTFIIKKNSCYFKCLIDE